MKAISTRLGMNTETLQNWVRQAEIDEGQGGGDHDAGVPGAA